MAPNLLRLLAVAAVIAGSAAPAIACDDDGGEYTNWVSLLPSAPIVVATSDAQSDAEDG